MSEIDKSPANLPLKFVSGDDFALNIRFSESIIGDSFRAQILKDSDLKASFSVATTSTSTLGTLNILLTETQTALLFGKYSWFLERTHGTETRTLIASTEVSVLKK
jgi:hypothetical protein